MTSTDVGNIYTRKLEEYFESEAFDIGAGGQFRRIEWSADAPAGSSMLMQVRTAATREVLAESPWTGWNGAGTYYQVNGMKLQGIPTEHHWIQYKAILTSAYGATWPVLDEVRIIYHPGGAGASPGGK